MCIRDSGQNIYNYDPEAFSRILFDLMSGHTSARDQDAYATALGRFGRLSQAYNRNVGNPGLRVADTGYLPLEYASHVYRNPESPYLIIEPDDILPPDAGYYERDTAVGYQPGPPEAGWESGTAGGYQPGPLEDSGPLQRHDTYDYIWPPPVGAPVGVITVYDDLGEVVSITPTGIYEENGAIRMPNGDLIPYTGVIPGGVEQPGGFTETGGGLTDLADWVTGDFLEDTDIGGTTTGAGLLSIPEAPSGYDPYYAPVERDPFRADWAEGEFREELYDCLLYTSDAADE